ncbi:GL17251 [Drosophila persimilis]|uniref:GL17251 n=1 Tax=Drosophila persimilis TaxID=7234 RepID=B4GIQ6_DROPE|nr:GL17251 [Drosophila persimilis]
MPPEGKRAYTKAKVWYLNPQFRKDHEAGSRSVCNVCREVHPPRGSDEQAPVKVQQEVQTEKVCSCSSSSGSSDHSSLEAMFQNIPLIIVLCLFGMIAQAWTKETSCPVGYKYNSKYTQCERVAYRGG